MLVGKDKMVQKHIRYSNLALIPMQDHIRIIG